MAWNKTSLLILTVGFIALLGGASGAPYCLADLYAVGGGGSCSGESGCRGGFYCNNQSICAENLRINSPCIDYLDTCAFGSVCKGRTGFQNCIANAGPGDSCNSQSTSTLPNCGSGLSCDFTSQTCIAGGGTNDTCAKNIDCVSLICQNAKCLGFPRGASCQSTPQCAPGLFCQGYTGAVNGTCVPLLTSGACPNGNECAVGYICASPNLGDVRQCLQESSRKAGDYCGNQHFLCDSKRCTNQYCARNPGEYCYSSSHCGGDQVCGCSGSYSYDGVGSCTARGCVNIYKDLLKCFNDNCNGNWQNMLTYSTSCLHTLCSGQAKGFIACEYAAGMTLSVSVFFVAFLAFFATSFKL